MLVSSNTVTNLQKTTVHNGKQCGLTLVKSALYQIAFLFLMILTVQSSTFAQSKEYGLHVYGRGSSELILPYDLARELSDKINSEPDDVILNNLVDKIFDQAKNFAKPFATRASVANAIFGLALWTSRWQIKEQTSRGNFDGYGFKMLWGNPYAVVRYPYRDGTLLKGKSSPHVYVVVGNVKFYVPRASYFQNDWRRVRTVEEGQLRDWVRDIRPYTLVKEEDKPEVWVMLYDYIDYNSNPGIYQYPTQPMDHVRRHVMSYEAMRRIGLDWSDLRVLPAGSFNRHPYLRGYRLY